MSGRVLQPGEQIGFVPLEGEVSCQCPARDSVSRACICRSTGSARTDAGGEHEPDVDGDEYAHVRLDGDGALRLRKAAAWLGHERVAELEAENDEQRKLTSSDNFRTLFLETIEKWAPDVATEARKRGTEFARAVYDALPYPPGFGDGAPNTTERNDARHQTEETNTMSHDSARAAADAAFRSAWAHPGDATNLTPTQQTTRRADALARTHNQRRENEYYRQVRSDAIGAELARVDAADADAYERAAPEEETPLEELKAVADWAKQNNVKLDDALKYLEQIRGSRAEAREAEVRLARKNPAARGTNDEEEGVVKVDSRDPASRSRSAYQQAKDRMCNAWREPTNKLDKGAV